MDPISHAALGAAAAQTAASGRRLATAGLVAAVAALAPDLDTLIQSSQDPLLFLEYHRQFTHSFVFAPIAALVLALLFKRFVGSALTFVGIYVACAVGYVSHLLLDTCTTYGTELFWPFSRTRVAWNIIAVFDPSFTAPVVVLGLLAAVKRRARYALAAAGWAFVYLAFGLVQHSRAGAAGEELAAARGHMPARLVAIPAFSSMTLWKLIYEHDGRYYVDAVRTGFSTAVVPGESTEKLDLARHFPWLEAGSQQAVDVERFRRVSADWLAIDDGAPNRIVDLRYSLVPSEIAGFWAIVLDSNAATTEHVTFIATRENAPEQALRLLDMLFGS